MNIACPNYSNGLLALFTTFSGTSSAGFNQSTFHEVLHF